MKFSKRQTLFSQALLFVSFPFYSSTPLSLACNSTITAYQSKSITLSEPILAWVISCFVEGSGSGLPYLNNTHRSDCTPCPLPPAHDAAATRELDPAHHQILPPTRRIKAVSMPSASTVGCILSSSLELPSRNPIY